jgi:hypothetical protein
MTLTQLAPPYPIFTDKSGSPLDNGYLYFGTVNLNPETNPITVYYDTAFTQPAAQPLRTSNGYVMRNGSPAAIYTNGYFSVTVRDKNKAMVIYSPSGYGITPGTSASSTDQMTYNEGDTGATTRVLTNRLKDRITIKDFGAVGDGVADDTAAIQAAITALGANGGQVYLPQGTYKVSSTINIPLATWKPVLLSGAANTLIVSTHNGTVFNDSTGNARFENIRFDGPGLANVNAKAIVSVMSQGWVRGCYFQDYRVGIDITSSSGAVIERNHFTLCQEGIRSLSVSPAFSNFAMVRNNWFDFCTYGCYFEQVYGLVFDNNAFEYNSVGFYANSVRLLDVRGCNWFESNTTNAFQIAGSSTGQINKNTRTVGNSYTVASGTSEILDYLTPSVCIVTNSTTQSVANNLNVNITFDTEVLDPAGLHSTSASTDQIVIKSAGLYEIVANLEMAAFAAGTTNTIFVRANINKNATAIKYVTTPMLVSQPTQISLVTTEELSNGDIIRLQVYQNTGGALNASGGTVTQLSVRQISTD